MERKEFAAKLLGNSFDDTWRGKAIDAIVKTAGGAAATSRRKMLDDHLLFLPFHLRGVGIYR